MYVECLSMNNWRWLQSCMWAPASVCVLLSCTCRLLSVTDAKQRLTVRSRWLREDIRIGLMVNIQSLPATERTAKIPQ